MDCQLIFIKCFFSRIKQILLDAFNYSFQVKRLFPSSRNGLISLIPKKNRDVQRLKNWRPIILLCADYKLLSKVISSRVTSALALIIGKEQNGFIKGCNIATNIRKVVDTIRYAEKYNIDSLLLSIDFKKAFDRAEYLSLYKVLEYFGYGTEIIKWIQLLFTDFNLATINCGYISAPFTPTRGLFQGNPISSTAFLLIIELLAISIKANNKIEGIKIGQMESLLSMFADDLNIIIKNKQRCWDELVYEITLFQKATGMKVNYDKSTVYRLGSAKKSKANTYSLKKLQWSSGPVNILGIWVSNNDMEMEKLNINPLLDKARAITRIWKARSLSLMGSILIFNSLIASLFNYRLAVLRNISQYNIKEFNEIATNFVWQGKRAKIPLQILQASKECGGLGLCNIKDRETLLKLQWIKRVHEDELIMALANDTLENSLGLLVWRAQLSEKDISKHFVANNFWGDVLAAWSLLSRYPTPSSTEQVAQQMIWYNSNMKIDQKVVCYPGWIERGVISVSDLTDVNGTILNYPQFCQKFDFKPPFTQYYGIVAAIPEPWKTWMKANINEPKNIDWLEILKSMKSITHASY